MSEPHCLDPFRTKMNTLAMGNRSIFNLQSFESIELTLIGTGLLREKIRQIKKNVAHDDHQFFLNFDISFLTTRIEKSSIFTKV